VGAEAVTRDDRQLIIVADTGPLIRLAAAGLLPSLKGLNRRIVLGDRVIAEATADRSKPHAADIALWIDSMGDAILRATTVVGEGIAALSARKRDTEGDAALKAALRNSGEMAIREFVERWRPADATSTVVLYEDRKVPALFLDCEFGVELMTTRAFVRHLARWGINAAAEVALERVADRYDMKPALLVRFNPDEPADSRRLPSPMDEMP
jgi:hypothetical protein